MNIIMKSINFNLIVTIWKFTSFSEIISVWNQLLTNNKNAYFIGNYIL